MLEKIAAAITASGTVAILPHVSADGDALGSSFALALALSGIGKNAVVLLEEKVPLLYRFLPGINYAMIYEGSDMRYDIAVALDCGDIGRLGSRKQVLENAAATANIDHHTTNTGFAMLNYVDETASSTGEIIFILLRLMECKLDKNIATSLYTAISTDTGGFRYSNTTAQTHKVVADLLSLGVDAAEISRQVFDITSYEKVKLTGAAIQSLELFAEGRIAVMTLDNETIMNAGAAEEDSNGIINIARNIRGVEVAAMLRQLDNGEIRVNLRSNTYVDVSAVAERYSGGGHKRAAGFTAIGDPEQVKAGLIEELQKVL